MRDIADARRGNRKAARPGRQLTGGGLIRSSAGLLFLS
jgi:hypothetical protein